MRKFLLIIGFVIGYVIPSEAYGEPLTQNKATESFQFFTNPIAGPEEAIIEIYLTNTSQETLEFESNTSQWYEIIIMNQKDEIVYKYSEGRFFLQALQYLTLKPGQTKTWVDTWKYPDRKKITPGKYKVTVQLKAKLINKDHLHVQHENVNQKTMVIPPENPILKNIVIKKSDDKFLVSGSGRPTTNSLYYTVEDGHHEWVKETKININTENNNWADFSFDFKLPKDKYPVQLPLVINIYEKDDKGKIIHSYPKLLKRET